MSAQAGLDTSSSAWAISGGNGASSYYADQTIGGPYTPASRLHAEGEVFFQDVSPFNAADVQIVVGYFDSIEEMEKTYDQYAGAVGVEATETAWKLVK